jgi:hypothetical protein
MTYLHIEFHMYKWQQFVTYHHQTESEKKFSQGHYFYIKNVLIKIA